MRALLAAILMLMFHACLASGALAATTWERDAGFGGGDGIASPPEDAWFSHVEQRPDGSMWVIGGMSDGASSHPLVGRISPSGVADTAFDGDGYVTLDSATGYATDVVELADGDVAVVLSSEGGLSSWRLNSEGQVDLTWGTAGVLVAGTAGDKALRGELAADGDLLLAGRRTIGYAQHTVVTKLDASTGAPDLTFGTAGEVVTDQSVWSTYFTGPDMLEVSVDGTITVGFQWFRLYLERFTATGAPDLSFAGDGSMERDMCLDARASDAVVTGTGSVAFAREYEVEPGDPTGFVVENVAPDAPVGTGCDGNGGSIVDLAWRFPESFWVDGYARLSDGGAVVTGNSYEVDEATGAVLSTTYAIARTNATGALVTSSGIDGVAVVDGQLRDPFVEGTVLTAVRDSGVVRLVERDPARPVDPPPTVADPVPPTQTVTTGTTTGSPEHRVAPTVRLKGSGRIDVRRNRFSIPASCPAGVRDACVGKLVVRSSKSLAGSKRSLALCSVNVPAGSTAVIRCRLHSKVVRLMRVGVAMPTVITVTATAGGLRAVTTHRRVLTRR